MTDAERADMYMHQRDTLEVEFHKRALRLEQASKELKEANKTIKDMTKRMEMLVSDLPF
jgi:hypothetical protein